MKIINNKLYIPKFREGIKLKLHRLIGDAIKRCTISKTPTGSYFVSILCEVQYQPKPKTGKILGIDLGLKDFAVTSDGIRIQSPRYFKGYEQQLAHAQRHLFRKENGSNKRNKQRLKVARLYEKISNSRLDFLHKLSMQIANAYDVICVEDLNIKGLLKNRRLAKHIADVSWGTFIRLLKYKAEWNDKQMVKVGRFFPSSKTCHYCGYIYKKLKLSEREWICPDCGQKMDRDINAIKNTLEEGLNILSGGTLDYTCGGLDKTSPKEKRRPRKRGTY